MLAWCLFMVLNHSDILVCTKRWWNSSELSHVPVGDVKS